MTDIIPGLTSHQYEGRSVRSSFDSNGQQVVIATDLCDLFGLEWRHVRDRLPDWGKGGPVRTATLGGEQTVATLTLGGTYWVALRSDKPEAKPLQEWVCNDLLPTLQKQGVYRLASSATLRQIDRLKLRLEAAELRAKAQALDALARGDRARPEEGGVTDRPEGWLSVPEFVVPKLPKTDPRYEGALLRLGWQASLRKAVVGTDVVRARIGNSVPRRVFRPDLLEAAWTKVAADIGLDQGNLDLLPI